MMSTARNRLKKRNFQVYHVKAGPDLVAVTVEMVAGHIKLGVAVGLQVHSNAMDSKDVNVQLFGRGHFNPVLFPHEGILPELQTGGSRSAVATFEFVAVEGNSRPQGAELTLRGRQYRVVFSKSPESGQEGRNHIPASVAKVLPSSWPKRSK
jgi:hypothetical protein